MQRIASFEVGGPTRSPRRHLPPLAGRVGSRRRRPTKEKVLGREGVAAPGTVREQPTRRPRKLGRRRVRVSFPFKIYGGSFGEEGRPSTVSPTVSGGPPSKCKEPDNAPSSLPI